MKTVMTFGRMNPPTRGHEKLVDRVKELAGDGDHHVFVSGSHDPKRLLSLLVQIGLMTSTESETTKTSALINSMLSLLVIEKVEK